MRIKSWIFHIRHFYHYLDRWLAFRAHCRQQAKWKGLLLEDYLKKTDAREQYHSLSCFVRVAFHS
jgi:hypothetical protein